MINPTAYTAAKRRRVLLPYLRGKCLDVGCGDGSLIREWRARGGLGLGIDPFTCGGCISELPDASYDTIILSAVLNHIPLWDRSNMLRECRRVLCPGGRLLITMIGPWVGWLAHHLLYPWDRDQQERGMELGESWGLGDSAVRSLLRSSGFVPRRCVRFNLGLCSLYVCEDKHAN